MQALFALYSIIKMISDILKMLVLIQFVVGLLFAFNVVNHRNEMLTAFYNGIQQFLEPVLGPIRRRLPATGAIDFSPLVLVVLLQILLILLDAIIRSVAA